MKPALRIAACLFAIAACSPAQVSHERWRAMSHDDRLLYVQTLLGAEKAKEAKGGAAKVYPEAPEEYVKKIEAAYARGDQRNPEVIFEELGR
jgi:hypothetical protein